MQVVIQFTRAVVCLGIFFLLPSCSEAEQFAREPTEEVDSVDNGVAQEFTIARAGLTPAEQGLPPLESQWLGDFDRIRESRTIRLLTVFSKMLYFLDGVDQRGATYEAARAFEQQLNESLDTGNLPIHVLIIPVTRDRLIPALVEGYGDIAAANLTITPERLELVDFSDPFLTGVNEIVVTGPAGPTYETIEDLSGTDVWVRPSSSYHESLLRLNDSFRARGLDPVNIVAADEYLETEDLLEMVNGGLLPAVVVDDHMAEFWAQIFDQITLHPNLAVNESGEIAWAFRKDSPELTEMINAFVATARIGTFTGNVIRERYLQNTNWVRNALDPTELGRFEETISHFQSYGAEFSFDWLLLAAQGYQESRLRQSARSPVGAIGVMQLLPTTASDPNVGIANIEILDNNIHAGAKYLRFLADRYFPATELDPLNRTLLSFAAYNAGPRRVAQLRAQTSEMGLDPDLWFNNVEIAASRRIGRETVQYVSNIYKYYISYTLIRDTLVLRREGP